MHGVPAPSSDGGSTVDGGSSSGRVGNRSFDRQSRQNSGTSALRVLIVEDELILAMDLEDMLTEAGHEVVGFAADMHQALVLAKAHAPDLALMDVNLARGTNGVETAMRLRQLYDVPSLFVSGNLDPKTRASAAPCQPVGFVPKPFSPDAVLGAIAAIT